MKKSLLILTLVAGVSQIAAKKHKDVKEEQKSLVSLAYGDVIQSCQLIRHTGDSFTYNDSAYENGWGDKATINHFMGCELQCYVVIKTGHGWEGYLSLPVDSSYFAPELQKQLVATGTATIAKAEQIYGRLWIGHDALGFIPTAAEEQKPLVSLAYGDVIQSCELIKHNGDLFTYNDSAYEKGWGRTATINNFTGCELQCYVVIKTGHGWEGYLSLPVDPSHFASELQKQLVATGTATIAKAKQIHGKLWIGHDALGFTPTTNK